MTNVLMLCVAVMAGEEATSAAPAWSASRAGTGAAAFQGEAGFLVVAPDRGFQGNEEIRDAFEAFSGGRNAALAFATDERTRDSLRPALETLARNGARRAVVLPLFMSAADPRLALVRNLLSESASDKDRGRSRRRVTAPIPVTFAPPFGESYLAVEVLADRFRAIEDPNGRRVIVVGYGATDEEIRSRMEGDWQRLAEHAAQGFGFGAVRTVIWHDRAAPDREARQREAERALADAATGGERVAVVPFHFGRKLDGMMSFDADLKRRIPAGSELVTEAGDFPAALTLWMSREANRSLALKPEDTGVIFLAHGSDYHWNETMRQAVEPLAQRYKIEFVFSMADQALIERAVRRLERRGAQAVVIVRVFGLADAFREEIERMIGLDVEGRSPARVAHASHGGGHGHDDSHGQGGDHGGQHGGTAGSPARIRSSLPMISAGGVEADALFARVLLDRARELSREPGRETVILTAHGSGDDAKNGHWLKNLEAMTAHMRSNGGAAFRAIRFATWREDWPEKRAPWIAKVKEMVTEAAREEGRAIVIPARTTGQGPEKEFLRGLDFELGSGFAPHPLFARWVERQISAGVAALGRDAPRDTVSALTGVTAPR
ncbi:MAG: cobalamin biosynthesis protein CbiX [Betaproteobacteria bacterium]|nr:cobalamin biosynthesis protein CbiX [Betaproteobacteria bacterium]